MNSKVSLIAIGLTLSTAGIAAAQSATERVKTSTTETKPTRTQSTQTMMQNSGGSLLQATLPRPAENSDPAKPQPVSLIDVPEAPPHVLKKHDLVNIVVQESSKSESTGTTDLKKTADFDAKVDAFVKLNLAKLSVQGGAEGANPPELKLEAARNTHGEGTYDRSDTVSLRLEAEVIDVKPGGQLVVQARRHIKTDEEELSVTLTGECRVADVDATNSVLSTDLHNLDLEKTSKGVVRDRTKPGLVSRLLDFVNPF